MGVTTILLSALASLTSLGAVGPTASTFEVLGPATRAAETIILVAPRDTPAAEFAASRANDQTVFAERRLHRALTRAGEILAQGGPQTVSILVAEGAYPGRTGTGVWEIPTIDNPEARLRILGGFNADFTGRQPFSLLSELETQAGRPGAFITVGRRSRLAELVISGLIFDAAPSNRYDAQTNSILKGQSRTYPLISFQQLRVDHLVVADNVFINGAHGAFDPGIAGAPGAVVDIQNNFFLNTIKGMTPAATSGGEHVDIRIRNNSFILNWPYNPDAASSNVGALELYHADGYKSLLIQGNLFAFNPGGAMQHDWAPERMGQIAIIGNLFHANGSLFSTATDEEGVIVGKFGPNPSHLPLDLMTIEDDLDYDVRDNVSMDPGIGLAIAPLQAVDSDAVQREATVVNDVRRILGLSQSGGAVPISNYAPRMAYVAGAPIFPTVEAARPYGVQPAQLWSASGS